MGITSVSVQGTVGFKEMVSLWKGLRTVWSLISRMCWSQLGSAHESRLYAHLSNSLTPDLILVT